MKVTLPAFTQFLFSTSVQAAKYTWLLISAIIISLVGIFFFLRSSKGKKFILGIVSPLPVISTILKQVDLARFSRIFSTLIKSAVPITDALDISLSTMSWKKYQNLNEKVGTQIKKGKSLSAAFKTVDDFPIILIQMIAAGEKSGSLDDNLAELSDFYEQEVEEAVKKATTLLEPMLMLFMGVGVGGLILSVLGPIYSLVGSLQDIR